MLVGFSGCVCAYGFAPRMFFAPDTGDGTGSGVGGSGDDANESETFTKEEVESVVKKRVRKLTRDLQQKDTKLSEVQKQLDELTAKFEASEDSGDESHDDKRVMGELELLRKKLETRVAELEKQNQESESKLGDEVKRRRAMEMQREIDKGLDAVQCIDRENGTRIFRDSVKWDEEAEEFVFVTKNGNEVSVIEGIKAECPDYLKPASMRGGSGSTSTRSGARAKQLQSVEEEIDKVKTQIKRSPHDNSALVKLQQLKRERDELTKTANAA